MMSFKEILTLNLSWYFQGNQSHQHNITLFSVDIKHIRLMLNNIYILDDFNNWLRLPKVFPIFKHS